MFNTPLGSIINLDGENKILKASIYNSLGILLLILIAVSVVSVYFLFEIFITPLMWALLVGTCLFPFKRSLTSFLHNWLVEMESKSRPLIVGSLIFPFDLFYRFSEWITELVIVRIKLLIFYIIGVPLIYSIYNVGIMSIMFSTTTTIYFSASSIMSIFGSKIVTMMILTMIVVLFSKIVFCENINVKLLKILSSCIWILSIVHLSNFAGTFALFIFSISIILFIFGLIVESMDININQFSLSQLILVWEFIARPYKYSSRPGEQSNLSEEEVISENDTLDNTTFISGRTLFSDMSSPSESMVESKKDATNDFPDKGDLSEFTRSTPKKTKVNFLMETASSTFMWCSNLFTPISKKSPKRKIEKHSSAYSKTRQSNRVSKKIQDKTLVRRVFICLLWTHVILYSWSHLWIILVVIIAILLVTFKKILIKLEVQKTLNSVGQKFNKLFGDRRDIIFPQFIQGSFRIFLQFDEKVRKMLDSCIDSLVSVFVIAFLLLSTIFLTVFLAFQVHNESLQLIALTTNVLNSTLSSENFNWIPERKDITTILEAVTNNVYVFGREWISKKIDQLFDTNTYNKVRIEEQALEFWEKLYQRVLIKNTGNTSQIFNQPLKSTRQYSFLSLQKHIYSFWDLITSFDALDMNKISNLLRENLGLMSTVLESIWLVIHSNLNFMLTLLTGIFSIILGSGSVVLNFFVSSVIFLSALYYLLSYSKEQYLPMNFIATLTPNSDNNPTLQSIYTSVENGISSVFAVTMKMACFYGFYTCLTHTICGVNLVVIPSIFAALLAAVPIVGTYWAAVPAITELVFINQEYTTAIILLSFHLAPVYFLDTAIYSEIKETGHPYLTGLAIAGGIYWLGLQGAVMGPLLLCTLVIVLNLFKTLIMPDTMMTSPEKIPPKSPKILKKSKSCDPRSKHPIDDIE